jgi:2-C-methyl-D-erythritol 4-phosphate cytidylyltransferase/2-C-methyl-D-erythritol 2,4-cyclodiphosphate synthase
MQASLNKLLLTCEGHPLIYYTLRNVFKSHLLSELVIVTKPEERPVFESIVSSIPHRVKVLFAKGGEDRAGSVKNGFSLVSRNSDKVLVHDGARPLVDGETIDEAFRAISDENPAVAVGVPCIDTIKKVEEGHIVETPERSTLFRAQTPQGALTDLFQRAVDFLSKGGTFTDDASVLEKLGVPVQLIPGKERFFKVTTPEDMERLGQMLRKDRCPFRVGQGYDIHRFDDSRPLYLGGLKISDTGGLLGYSDADVLLHAIMDALLGACGLPDIGHYFPDTDDRFEGADSSRLLAEVKEIIEKEGYAVGNIDSTVIAEKPKLAQYIPAMKERIAGILDILPMDVGIKATTNEKLGAVGRREGIAAMASAIVFRRSN